MLASAFLAVTATPEFVAGQRDQVFVSGSLSHYLRQRTRHLLDTVAEASGQWNTPLMLDSSVLERDGEIDVVGQAVAKAVKGSGALVLITGVPGIGKSRLLEQCRNLAAANGMRVLRSRGSSLEREFGFGIVRQLFESLLRSDSKEQDRWLSGPAANARSILFRDDAYFTSGEYAVLNGLFWMTSNISRDVPLAVVIDDLHLADEPSLRYLAFLLPRLEDLGILVLGALRPQAPGAATMLLDLISTDAATTVLTLAPLTTQACALILRTAFGKAPEPEVVQACYTATGGNPLLITELARAVKAEGLSPKPENIETIMYVATQSIARRTALQLSRLSPENTRLAEALAVLSPRPTVDAVARLARLSKEEVRSGLEALWASHLVSKDADATHATAWEFTHPLIQAAVYEQIDHGRRSAYHTAACNVLRDGNAAPEELAAHLLRIPPVGDPDTVTTLRSAAKMYRSAPEAALTYLRRALEEPPPAESMIAVLTEAGVAASKVDLRMAVDLLLRACEGIDSPVAFADVAGLAAFILTAMSRLDEAEELLRRTIINLPPSARRQHLMLTATLITAPMVAVGTTVDSAAVDAARELALGDEFESRVLEGVITMYDTYTGDPRGISDARRLIEDPRLLYAATHGSIVAAYPFATLVMADIDEGFHGFDTVIAEARNTGELASLAPMHIYRGLAWLRRGELAEAETDLREARRLARMVEAELALLVSEALLVETLLDQGQIGQAQSMASSFELPSPLPRAGLYFYTLHAKARVFRATHDNEQALAAALAAGARLASHAGGKSPAMIPWRSEAALNLHALGRDTEASELAMAELELARRWGAPFTLGHALRTAGLVIPGPAGEAFLREAVSVLEASSAKLEAARALIDLGGLLRRTNRRIEAKAFLSSGLERASRCGAISLREHAVTELRAMGARPRRVVVTGPGSLTVSEQRVADLAAQELTNRQIAQRLFITVKTVEVHLSAVYRKLGISQRRQLRDQMSHPG